MFTALSMFFQFFTTMFSAANHGAKAVESWAIYAEETSGISVDTARADRQARIDARAKATN